MSRLNDGFYYGESVVSGEKTYVQVDGETFWMIGCGEPLKRSDFYELSPANPIITNDWLDKNTFHSSDCRNIRVIPANRLVEHLTP